MSKRHALVNLATRKVENAILWDGETVWPVPEGHILVASDEANIGDVWDGEEFTTPETP